MNLTKYIATVLLAVCANVQAQNSSSDELIAQLSDVWAVGHFLSPDIACDPQRWDAAFGKAAAKLAQSSGTLLEGKTALIAASGSYFARPSQEPYRLRYGTESRKGNQFKVVSNLLIGRIFGELSPEEIKTIKTNRRGATLVLDLRSASGQGILDLAARSAVFEDSDVLKILGLTGGQLPSMESVFYQGYPNEWGFSSGYFRSALVGSVTDQETAIGALTEERPPQIVVLGNRYTVLPRAIMAARLSGHALFISTDDAFSFGGLPSTEVDTESSNPIMLLARYKGISLQRALAPDLVLSSICVADDHCLADFVARHRSTALHDFQNQSNCTSLPASEEILASTDSYPSLESRLYAAAKLYHVLRLFHPAPDLLGDNLRERYVTTLHDVASASDASEYAMAIARFLAPMKDGHIEVIGLSYFEAFGSGDLPLSTFFYKDEVYIGCNSDEAPDLKRGDRVVSVDGQNIGLLLSAINELKTTPAGRDRLADSARYIFRGKIGSKVLLQVQRQDGSMRKIELTRTRRGPQRCALPWAPSPKIDFKWVRPDIAYLNLAVVTPPRIDGLMTELSRAKYLIVDDRGRANGGGWSIAAHLSEEQHIRVARFVTPLIHGRESAENEYHNTVSVLSRYQEIRGGAKPLLSAKLIVLIDDNTSSQAEHSLLMLKAATNTHTVGTRTAGTLGDATALILPGNLPIRFTGQSVEDLSGRRVLGLGIEPDTLVTPTLKDLLESRDPVLEAAISLGR